MRLQQYLRECYTDSFRSNYFKAIKGEYLELVDALKKRDWKESSYEASQLALYLLIGTSYALEKVGIRFNPLVPNWMPWNDDYVRMDIWKEILIISGAPNQELDLEWFNKGNNWERPSKVMYVLSQAGIDVTEEEAERLIKVVRSLR